MHATGNPTENKQEPETDGSDLLASLPTPVLNLGPDGTIRAVNRAFLSESGYLPGEVVGSSILCLVHKDSVDRVSEAFSRCLAGEDSGCTLKAVAKNGGKAAYKASGTPVWGGDGLVRSVFVVSWADLGERIGHAAVRFGPPLNTQFPGDRRQSVNLNDCIRRTAGVAGGEEMVLSLSPRVPHTMADMAAAEKLAAVLLEPSESCQSLLKLATRRHKGTIVLQAVYGGTDSVPASLSWIAELRKAASSLSGGFHVQSAPDGGSEITITVPILLPEKNGTP